MAGNLPTAVTAELFLQMVLDLDRTVDVPCALEYRAEEPYAVRATFRTGSADIEWMFARDLIAEGLSVPSGEGDVVVWPEDGGERQLVLIALNSPTGQAVLEADRAEIAQFLERTFDIVPAGTESDALDIDSWIAQILGEAANGH
ncbi:MAG: SsgA family sporulation/cell division regulator [Candidatus Nanopelagicales bacterium]